MKSIKQFELRTRRVPIGCKVCGSIIKDPTTVAQAARSMFKSETKAKFFAFYLGLSGEVLGYSEVAKGCQDQITIDPINIFRDAILLSCHSLVIAHNHPRGGGVTEYDVETTKLLQNAGRVIGIPLVDHVVISGGEAISVLPYLAEQPTVIIKKKRKRKCKKV